MTEYKTIPPQDLADMATFATTHPLRVDLVYAQPAHKDNMFKTAIYHATARMWCHKDLAKIICRAATLAYAEKKCLLELKDCLRPVEAQEKIVNTSIVRANPHWLEEPRMFALPGQGGHPRGMAVDLVLITENGDEIDMGTPFDHMTGDPSYNPAARAYTKFDASVLANRRFLETCMVQAAQEQGHDLLPLPAEWWDFRFPSSYSHGFAPIRDADLPPDMRMTAPA